MRIQHNITAMNAYRQLGGNNNMVSKNLEKLSSGYKINRAGDDAAGLAISEKMRAQIRSLDTAQKNANDGISLIQTAEGALTEVHSMLNRMVELSTQSANGIYTDADRQKLQDEMTSLKDEINRISKATNFNGIKLLDGSLAGNNATVDGVSLVGASVAKFEAAKITGDNDLSGAKLEALDNTIKDYLTVDGQSLTLDWSKGKLKDVANMLKKDFDASTMTADDQKAISKALTEAINEAITDQGLKGSVKVTADAGKFSLESTNKSHTSNIGWTGSDKVQADATTLDSKANSFGFALFGTLATGTTAPKAIVADAGKIYNGDTLGGTEEFQFNINGRAYNITAGAWTKGTTPMETIATALQTAIQAEITSYNTDMGLAAGDEGFLTAADFTVEASKEGGFTMKYNGDVDNVQFSFENIGDDTTASSLGLDAGSSAVGSGKGLVLQIGDTSDSYQKVAVSVGNMSAMGIGIQNIDITTAVGASNAKDTIDGAIEKVSVNRSALGALQNRLEHTVNNLGVTSENMSAAESRIRDVDMAKEMMDFTKNNILTQAAQAMLAQANQIPQGVLQLLR